MKRSTGAKARTERKHFTEARIEALPVPDKRRIIYDAKGTLGLKLTPGGARTFFWFRCVPYENQPKRWAAPTWKTIGPWPEISLVDARTKAKDYDSLLENWRKDGCKAPSPFRVQTTGLTLAGLVEAYLTQHLRKEANDADKAEKELRSRLSSLGVKRPNGKKSRTKPVVEWHDRPIATITGEDVAKVHGAIGEKTKARANRVIEDLRAMWNWAHKAKLYSGENPAKGIETFAKVKRKRFLQPAEFPSLFAAMNAKGNRDLRDFILLALTCGARKADILSMRWDKISDLDLPAPKWTCPNTKTGEEYEIPLMPQAIAVLRERHKNNGHSPWVFPGRGKTEHLLDLKRSWKSLREAAGIKNLRQHDLRRTLGSWQAGLGVSLPVIGRSLGHSSAASTEVYAHVNLDPVRDAMTTATRAMFAASRKKVKALPAAR